MDSMAQGARNNENNNNNNNDLLNLKYYGFRGRQRPMEPLDFVSDTKIVLWKTTIVWMQVTREIGPLSIRVLIEDDSNRVGIVPFASRTLRTRALNNNEVQSLAKEAENVQEYSDLLQDSRERMAIVLKVKYVVGEARKKGTIIIQIIEQNSKVVEEKQIKFVVQSRHYAQRSHLLSPQYRRESKLKAQSEKIRSSRRKSALSSSVSSDPSPSPSPSPPSSPPSVASLASSSSPAPSLVLAASSFDDTSSSLLSKHEDEDYEEEYTETRSSRGRKIKKKQMGPKKPPKVTKQLETETRAMKRRKAQEAKEVKDEKYEAVGVSVLANDEDDRLDKVNKQDDDYSFDSEDEDSSVASMLDFSSKIVNFPTHKILHSMVQNPHQPPPFPSFNLPHQQHQYPHPHHHPHHHQYPHPHHTSLYGDVVPQEKHHLSQSLPPFSYSLSPSHSGPNTRNNTLTTTTTSSSTNTLLLSSSHSFVSLDNNNEPNKCQHQCQYNSKNNLDMLLGPAAPSSSTPLPSSSSYPLPLSSFAPLLGPFPAPLSPFDVKK